MWQALPVFVQLRTNPVCLTNSSRIRRTAPLMIAQKRGPIAQVVDSDMLFSVDNFLSQMVKFSLKGLAPIISEERRSHGVTSIAITPG